MEKMFCFQCEQTSKGLACTTTGVCGKVPAVAHEQDLLTCEMISLACAATKKGKDYPKEQIADLLMEGLFTTVTNVSFNVFTEASLTNRIKTLRKSLGGKTILLPYDLFHGDKDEISLKSTLLFGLRGTAAYAYHACVQGFRDEKIDNWLIEGMAALSEEYSVEKWLQLLMNCGQINLVCMALLDRAHTESYGDPTPTKVSFEVEAGPFIVVTGHDLHDLKILLEQTEGTGVSVYTHGEMLPAHGYPHLKIYSHLKGNFGTAWQNQQNEFKNLPAPILFTSNCLMPPKNSYKNRVYTTSVVSYTDIKHIKADKKGHKDFSPLIKQAIELGGFKESRPFTGINGGKETTTGFGRKTILDHAPVIIEAVKSGAIKQFFLVGGCDGARVGRNYYTDFVKQTPEDSVVLTLGCGKYRFNDLDLGQIGPFPRILDMGQCNDTYGAIQVALALAEAFSCEVNELPLTLVLSWYEQKAVSVLLTLLSLGIKNIYIGPDLPAFFSEKVLTTLVDMFKLHPITTTKQDLKAILQK